MTLSNLSVLIFAFAMALFLTSQFAKRAGGNTPVLRQVVKGLAVIVLLLSAIYFYRRFFS